MKQIIISALLLTSGCITHKKDVLELPVRFPMRALRIEREAPTPTETVGHKFAMFLEAVKEQYPKVEYVPVYLSPKISEHEIQGWTNDFEMIALVEIGSASIRDSIRLFCEIYGFTYREEDGQIYVEEFYTSPTNDGTEPFGSGAP